MRREPVNIAAMEILYLLIPLALILVALIVVAFMWAVHSGQFEDLEGPAHSILMDDDEPARKDDRKPQSEQDG